ncbi:hypothetical protein B0A52_04168 [Exophiala mesophila]|uniref:Glycosyltransferase family 25 protein n=1 Tax=Exophiala mesophila TaxID=212818 RepID=A0A438NAI4_EXOME|nr:hypothetical protein B0A52_04168 [Exophiala mesophila]
MGFEKILAVSLGPSWRTRGLLAAAGHTGLSITIPEQPYNTEALIDAFGDLGSSDEKVKRPGVGSARAWLAHLDMMKYVISSGLSTAFIIEDDVDWDVRIHSQMKLVSDAVRNFTLASGEDTLAPFGNAWEVLWLGHCGEISERDRPKLTYFDETRPKTEHYMGWSHKYLENEEAIVPPTHRAVQRTRNTVCSFGYGVTHRGARNILRQLGQGQDEAFDIALMAHCRDGKLSCLTVLPEIMHHYEPKDGSGYVSPNNEFNGKGKSVDESEFEGIMGHTPNIVRSARCEALWGQRCQAGNE